MYCRLTQTIVSVITMRVTYVQWTRTEWSLSYQCRILWSKWNFPLWQSAQLWAPGRFLRIQSRSLRCRAGTRNNADRQLTTRNKLGSHCFFLWRKTYKLYNFVCGAVINIGNSFNSSAVFHCLMGLKFVIYEASEGTNLTSGLIFDMGEMSC